MSTRYDEKGKYFTEVITKEATEVIIQTPTHRIHGKMHTHPEERILDALNRSTPFLALTDVLVYGPRDEVLYRTKFMSINQGQISWLIPKGDLLAPEDEVGHPTGSKNGREEK